MCSLNRHDVFDQISLRACRGCVDPGVASLGYGVRVVVYVFCCAVAPLLLILRVDPFCVDHRSCKVLLGLRCERTERKP